MFMPKTYIANLSVTNNMFLSFTYDNNKNEWNNKHYKQHYSIYIVLNENNLHVDLSFNKKSIIN